MSTSPTAISREDLRPLQKARGFVSAALFLVIHRSPRLLQFHRNERSWTLFRVALGLFGAALVVLPLGLWNGWITAIFGLMLFVTSILLPPAEAESETDRKARELGAVMVVSGGEYQPGNAPAAQAHLFLSPSHVWALDHQMNPLVVIPSPELSSLSVGQEGDRWLLLLRWAEHKAEFSYQGFFAEQFARLALDSIRTLCSEPAPEPQLRRAAGA